MANLYLFKYNNYFNRLLKREESIEGYGDPIFILQNTNFNPNDGISTRHIVNADLSVDVPDYCVIGENNVIQSRWYVLEVSRIRAGQYRLELLRDVMAEYKNEILNSTAFIQKGYVNPSSPLIFNNEEMGFNQVKTAEYLLKNNINSPWLVLYLARYNNEGAFNSFSGEFVDDIDASAVDYNLNSLDDYKYIYWVGHSFYVEPGNEDIYFGAYYSVPGTDMFTTGRVMRLSTLFFDREAPIDMSGGLVTEFTNQNYPFVQNQSELNVDEADFSALKAAYNSGRIVDYNLTRNSYFTPFNVIPYSEFVKVQAENGKIIKVGPKYYRIQVESRINPDKLLIRASIPTSSNLGQKMKKAFFDDNNISTDGKNVQLDMFFYGPIPQNNEYYNFRFVEINPSTTPLTYSIPYDQTETKDATYEIIAAPFQDTLFSNVPGITGAFNHNGDIALQWFQNIINKYHGSNFAYDLQLVPYFYADTLDLRNEEVVFCKRGETNLALAIKAKKSNFSSYISVSDIEYREDPKKSNELDLYRIVSPNGIGEYEWSPAKNGGNPGAFEVDCTLIPYNPYIKITPVFSKLYGKDFNDYRGLICGGEFSLPIVSSEWQNYQLNNKYYQAIFDRSIEHQEFNNNYAMISDITGTISGTVSGAAAGAHAGAPGGPAGMIAGAVIGGVGSLVGGIADIVVNKKIRSEEIQYQKDRFGFELGTIKARAQSITRTTSFNQNNKYFPYVEYYTCTSVEEQAFENKILYNGMTVGVIGKIANYLNPDPSVPFTFVQGEIIVIDINEDYHVTARINEIFMGGIRIA